MFLNESGLELFMNTLQVVSTLEADTRTQVETKVLGLLVSVQYITDNLFTLSGLFYLNFFDQSVSNSNVSS